MLRQAFLGGLLWLKRSAKFPSYLSPLFIYDLQCLHNCFAQEWRHALQCEEVIFIYTHKQITASGLYWLKGALRQSVTESTNTSWDVPVSASHRQQLLWSLADVSSAASNICRWAGGVVLAQLTASLSCNRSPFPWTVPLKFKACSEGQLCERGQSFGKRRVAGGNEKCIWSAKPGISSQAF